MKEGKLVRTGNVVTADGWIDRLRRRPKLEMVGLGLFYGEPGLGKTTYARRSSLSQGFIYLRLQEAMRPKSMVSELLRQVQVHYGLGDVIPAGSTSNLFKRVLAILEDHEDAVIMVDEINYAFRRIELLNLLRDIVDETLAIVILIGEDRSRDRLLQINRRYFDRCNVFFEFERMSLEDVRLICGGLLEVEVGSDVVRYIHAQSRGYFRTINKMLLLVEQTAREKGLKVVTMKELD